MSRDAPSFDHQLIPEHNTPKQKLNRYRKKVCQQQFLRMSTHRNNHYAHYRWRYSLVVFGLSSKE